MKSPFAALVAADEMLPTTAVRATSPAASALLTSNKRRAWFDGAGRIAFSFHRSSDHQPHDEIQRIVVLRIAAEAVIVAGGAVEFPVGGVLEHQTQVAARQPVELRHDA